ncbi:hypothetical protein Acsp06_46230 [Actinomycetospora sp. NBRC 106375]|uniref:hypothetical protein n=1 Tax=Actinomycetospora sp. NBRC 106375 TaxID=3032207 RepID=UPI0024A2EF42|nr:hypothetical protein [Actinomycetospora sp. NBRC 106375]GLZ48438.1 hypothetical protein Acsp06_46230 [Actinomycetospora sp. NBRC 106375]
MTAAPDPEVRLRSGEARCDVCLAGPVEAVCSGCRARLCRAHDAILDPVGGLPFGRAARIRRTAWAASAGPDASGASRPDAVRPPGARPADDADDDDEQDDERPSSPGSSGGGNAGGAARSDRPKPTTGPVAGATTTAFAALGATPPPSPAPGWEAADRQARAEDRHLCPTCLPLDRRWDAELLAAGSTGVLAVGAFASSFLIPAAVLGAVAVGRVGARLTRARTTGRCRRRLPAFVAADPHVRKVRMTETVETRARLHPDQRYETAETTVRGEVWIDASWTRSGGGAALAKAAGADADVVAVGHVVLQGPGALRLDLTPGQIVTGDRVVSLVPSRADPAQGLPSAALPTGPWPVTVAYLPDPERAARAVDVWVTPTIGPDSVRRTLELDVGWRTRGEERYETGLALRKLDLVRVEIPESWGRIEQPSHPEIATIGRDDAGTRVVEWRNVRVEPENLRGVDVRFRRRGQEQDKRLVDEFTAGRTYGTIPLALRMAGPIPHDAELTARVEARFTGAVSGLTGAAVHYAGGGQRPEGRKAATIGPAEPPLAQGPRDATGPLERARAPQRRADHTRPARPRPEPGGGALPDDAHRPGQGGGRERPGHHRVPRHGSRPRHRGAPRGRAQRGRLLRQAHGGEPAAGGGHVLEPDPLVGHRWPLLLRCLPGRLRHPAHG